jgi:hypothetical protein
MPIATATLPAKGREVFSPKRIAFRDKQQQTP